MPEQKKALQEGNEADQWFLRNKSYLDNYDARHDIVLNTVQNYKLHPENILEIGCSAGHRLNSLKKLKFPGATVCGIDPSQQAVSYGAGIYPGVELTAGTADQMKMFADGQFDLADRGFRVLCDRQAAAATGDCGDRPGAGG